jgi:hypothetical protein
VRGFADQVRQCGAAHVKNMILKNENRFSAEVMRKQRT